MHEYTVVYAIEVDADSAQEAAQEAWRLLHDPESLPPVFEVGRTDQPDVAMVKIELTPDEPKYIGWQEMLGELAAGKIVHRSGTDTRHTLRGIPSDQGAYEVNGARYDVWCEGCSEKFWARSFELAAKDYYVVEEAE